MSSLPPPFCPSQFGAVVHLRHVLEKNGVRNNERADSPRMMMQNPSDGKKKKKNREIKLVSARLSTAEAIWLVEQLGHTLNGGYALDINAPLPDVIAIFLPSADVLVPPRAVRGSAFRPCEGSIVLPLEEVSMSAYRRSA